MTFSHFALMQPIVATRAGLLIIVVIQILNPTIW